MVHIIYMVIHIYGVALGFYVEKSDREREGLLSMTHRLCQI